MDTDRIAGSANNMAGKAEDAAGNPTGDTQTQAARAVREAAGNAQNLYGQAKDATRDAAGAALDYARGPASDALAKAVRDNPGGSLLIAALAGFALALLMRPQPRRRGRYY
jgi:uncharacterized protein YjbJ (UPF0337 family)